MTDTESTQLSKKAGLPPGTLIHIGEQRTERTEISIIRYNADDYQEYSSVPVDDIAGFIDDSAVTWVNVTGLAQTDIIEKI